MPFPVTGGGSGFPTLSVQKWPDADALEQAVLCRLVQLQLRDQIPKGHPVLTSGVPTVCPFATFSAVWDVGQWRGKVSCHQVGFCPTANVGYLLECPSSAPSLNEVHLLPDSTVKFYISSHCHHYFGGTVKPYLPFYLDS